jgi:TonB family protein
LRLPAVLLLLLLLPAAIYPTENAEKRKSAAHDMAKEFSRLRVQKIYVPDLCESSSRPSGLGAYFAATFSDLLAHKPKEFVVVSRIDAHRFLQTNHWTDCDLTNPEVLLKLSSEFGLDSILVGILSRSNDHFSIEFVLRDLSSKELFRTNYSEPYDAMTAALFPAVSSASGWPFYFPLLDGVTQPEAVRMQNPAYPSNKRRGISGAVILSALITTDGKVDQALVIQKLDPDLDKAAIDITRTWLFKPAKAPDGTRVPVRVAFQINYQSF